MHTFQIEGLGSELRVMRFDGHEGISQLSHFDVVVACAENDLAFASAVGKPAVLTFRVGDQPRYVHGIVSSFEQGEEGRKLTAYHITLVPNAWRLQHRRDSRIFQELSTPDILKKVLDKAGIADYKIQVSGAYSPREYCVQYRESDWSFLCRLMEEEGIYYYFEHTEDKDVLVIGDVPATHEPIAGAATIPYRASLGALVKTEHVSRFRYSERVRPGKVTLRDYNFKKPNLALESSKAGRDDTDLEIYDYPGDYEAPGGGSTFAGVRLEMLQATKKTGDGDSACPRLTPGYKFTLADHTRDDFNQEYLITRVDHQGFEPRMDAPMGDETPPYKNTFEVIPATVAFRPPQVTTWPTIKGIQTAIVVGPGGEEIYTDAHGRIKVQFHWDREGKKDEHASCWIRVSQIWAGGAWGAMFIPRIGHEVVVDFLEGDPDRPLVVGSVYHGANVTPYPLPAEKTKSTIKSNSSTGGGGSNELRFEDKKGSEEVYLHGQKDWNIKIEHDKNQLIGHDETKKVGHDETQEIDHDRRKTIKHDQFEAVHHDDTIEVGANRRETIGGNESVTISGNAVRAVGVSQTEGVGATYTLSVGGAMSQSVGGVLNTNVGGAKIENVGVSASQTVGGNVSLTAGRDYTVSVGASLNTSVGKDHAETADANRTITVAKKLTITVGESVVTLEKDGKITIQGKDITVQGEGTIHVQGKSKVIVKSDGPVQVEAAGEVRVKGSAVKMN